MLCFAGGGFRFDSLLSRVAVNVGVQFIQMNLLFVQTKACPPFWPFCFDFSKQKLKKI